MPPKTASRTRRRVSRNSDDDEYIDNEATTPNAQKIVHDEKPRSKTTTVKKRARAASVADDPVEIISGVRELELKEDAPAAKKGRTTTTKEQPPTPRDRAYAKIQNDAHIPVIKSRVRMNGAQGKRGSRQEINSVVDMDMEEDTSHPPFTTNARPFVSPLRSQWYDDSQEPLLSASLRDLNLHDVEWLHTQKQWSEHNLLFGNYTKPISTKDSTLTIDEISISPNTLYRHRTYVDAVRYGWKDTPDYQCVAFPFAEEKLRQCPPTTKALSLVLNVYDIADTVSALMFLHTFPSILYLELCLQSPNEVQEDDNGTLNVMAYHDVWNGWQQHIQWNLRSFIFSTEIGTSPAFEWEVSQLRQKTMPEHVGLYTRARFSHLMNGTSSSLSPFTVSFRFVEADIVSNPYLKENDDMRPSSPVPYVPLNIGYTRYFRWNSKFVTPDMTTKWLAPRGVEIFHGPSRCFFTKDANFNTMQWIRLTDVNETSDILRSTHSQVENSLRGMKSCVRVRFLAIDETNSWSKKGVPNDANTYLSMWEVCSVVIQPTMLYLETLTQLDSLMTADHSEWLDLQAVEELDISNALMHLDWVGFSFRLLRNRSKLKSIKVIHGSTDQHKKLYDILNAHNSSDPIKMKYMDVKVLTPLDVREMHQVVARHCALFTPCTSCFGQRSQSNVLHEEERIRAEQQQQLQEKMRKEQERRDAEAELELRAAVAARAERERARERQYEIELERRRQETKKREAEVAKLQREEEEKRLREEQQRTRQWQNAKVFQKMKEAQEQKLRDAQQRAQAAHRANLQKQKQQQQQEADEEAARKRQHPSYHQMRPHFAAHTPLVTSSSQEAMKQKTIEKLTLYLKNVFISNSLWSRSEVTKRGFSKFMRSFALIIYPDKCGLGPLDPEVFTKCERIVADVCTHTKSQQLLDQFKQVQYYLMLIFPAGITTDKLTCAELFSVCSSIRMQMNM